MDDAHADDWDRYGWDGYFALIRQHLDWDTIEKDEIDYKKKAEWLLRKVRRKILNGEDDWPNDVKAAPLAKHLANVVGPQWQWPKLKGWFDHSTEQASTALLSLWRKDDPWSGRRLSRDTVIGRIRDFSILLPKDVIAGVGGRLRAIAALLLAVDAYNYPPFMVTVFDDAYERTGFSVPPKDADEGVLYEHALTFLDHVVDGASARRLDWPRNRLEAQSAVWALWHRFADGGSR